MESICDSLNKAGYNYIRLIQSCHIGLSTQESSAAFNATSFPSKNLLYMANGLAVVSIDIPVIRAASIGNNLNYYAKQTPDNIAHAIILAKTDNNNRRIISDLETNFVRDISKII